MSYFVLPSLLLTFIRLITSVWEKRASITRLYFLFFSARRSSSSSGCLGKAAVFNCDTPWSFHIIILL